MAERTNSKAHCSAGGLPGLPGTSVSKLLVGRSDDDLGVGDIYTVALALQTGTVPPGVMVDLGPFPERLGLRWHDIGHGIRPLAFVGLDASLWNFIFECEGEELAACKTVSEWMEHLDSPSSRLGLIVKAIVPRFIGRFPDDSSNLLYWFGWLGDSYYSTIRIVCEFYDRGDVVPGLRLRLEGVEVVTDIARQIYWLMREPVHKLETAARRLEENWRKSNSAPTVALWDEDEDPEAAR